MPIPMLRCCRLAWLFLSLAALGACRNAPADAGATEPPPDDSPAQHLEGARRLDGLLELYLDEHAGALLTLLPAPDERGFIGEYLYVAGLTAGMGSNPVGLDRGLVGPTRFVRLRRAGQKVLVEELNLEFRASGSDPDERRAARESFATSILWAGEVIATDGDGRPLVDLTTFLVRDAVGIVAALARDGGGSYSLDVQRSALDAGRLLVFPDNVEIDVLVTFTGANPGPEARETVPEPGALTLVQHHSLIRPPDDGYEGRVHDPRTGAFAVRYLDYSAPLAASVERRYAVRHRLRKAEPGPARARALEPIVYYVDRGAPEPIRSALIEGASWWAAAFEAAGFQDAFRVELLPEGAHPLDVRYHVVQWVHRATRGWSYGGGVRDPRTGEMIKGHVRLGSLRIRQDRLLFEGLAGVERTGSGAPDDPLELALARIRQLAAHEVGHTLGLAHNFAASTYGDRASVMDYPPPRIRVGADGELDFSEAYAIGLGEWDVHAIRWLYSEFAPGVGEQAALDAIVAEGMARGLVYMSDSDARPAGAAHPLASLWDDGPDAVRHLEQALDVRRVALAQFGERNLLPGEPLARLEGVLAPVYFHHRYAVDAAAKLVGGLDYAHGLRGDGSAPARAVPAERQRAALVALAATLDPLLLDLPETALAALRPRAPGYGPDHESFAGRSAPAFDALGAAESAAQIVVDALLQRERCARLVEQDRRDPGQVSLEEVLGALVAAAFAGPVGADGRELEIQLAIRRVVVEGLVDLAADPRAAAAVRIRAERALSDLHSRELAGDLGTRAEVTNRTALRARVRRYLERTQDDPGAPTPTLDPPPGSPIGFEDPRAGCDFADCGWRGGSAR